MKEPWLCNKIIKGDLTKASLNDILDHRDQTRSDSCSIFFTECLEFLDPFNDEVVDMNVNHMC